MTWLEVGFATGVFLDRSFNEAIERKLAIQLLDGKAMLLHSGEDGAVGRRNVAALAARAATPHGAVPMQLQDVRPEGGRDHARTA